MKNTVFGQIFRDYRCLQQEKWELSSLVAFQIMSEMETCHWLLDGKRKNVEHLQHLTALRNKIIIHIDQASLPAA